MTDAAPARDDLAHIRSIFKTIERDDGIVRAYCDVDMRAARAESAQVGPLAGLTVGIKEVYDVAGLKCGWGSAIHANRIPAGDAEIVTALKRAGATIAGTTASTEYAMARMAPTTNPFDPLRTPGASSSGSAAAVAAGMADIAIGSQTIGSGIRPAAYCGVFGFKPSLGRFSLHGAMPLSEHLDHPVIFAKDMDLIGRCARILDPFHPWDDPVMAVPRVLLIEPWFDEAVDAEMWAAVRDFADRLGDGQVSEGHLPDGVREGEQDCLETILAADMWRHHGADFARAGDIMSDGLKGWLLRGKHTSRGEYERALAAKPDLVAQAETMMRGHDLIVTLATTGVAPLRMQGTGSRTPQRVWTLLGWPALSVPIGKIDGLPIAAQVIAPGNHDAALLRALRVAPCSVLPIY